MNITRSHELGFGRPLVKIHARSLPELFQQPRDLDNSQEAENLRTQNFKKSEKKSQKSPRLFAVERRRLSASSELLRSRLASGLCLSA